MRDSQRSLMYLYVLLVDGRWQTMSYLCLISSNDIILSELGRYMSWIFSNPFNAHVLNTASAVAGVKCWWNQRFTLGATVNTQTTLHFFLFISFYWQSLWGCSLQGCISAAEWETEKLKTIDHWVRNDSQTSQEELSSGSWAPHRRQHLSTHMTYTFSQGFIY